MALYYSRGTISHMSEITRGTGNTGKQWARMTIMLDVPGYQGSIFKIQFQVGTDHIDDVLKFKNGDKVEVGFSLYAREWNGKWYNNVDLVTIESLDQATGTQIAAGVPASTTAPATQRPAPRTAPAVSSAEPLQETVDDNFPF